MINRRVFLKQMALLGAAASMPNALMAEQMKTMATGKDAFIWANLIHLSYNFWQDFDPEQNAAEGLADPDWKKIREWAHHYYNKLTCDKEAWDLITQRMSDIGMNMVIIDLGDGVKYESHPEIAVEGAWSVSQLKKELKRLRRLNLEPIPKLNFSATHKAWMRPYDRMLSSEKYYTVCRNLIEETIDIFDTPRFLHLGMDEETYKYQKSLQYSVIRGSELWWHDFYYLIDVVQKKNVRPWIWSDYGWDNKDAFLKKMPTSVLQSNWYYGTNYPKSPKEKSKRYIEQFKELSDHGYDQIPAGSSWVAPENFEPLVNYCDKVVDPKSLKGFMQTTWTPTLISCMGDHNDALESVKNVILKRPHR